MSAALTLGNPDHLDRLLTLVTAFHDEQGIVMTPEARRAGIAPLLDGIPHGAVYLIGPPRAAIGYIVVTLRSIPKTSPPSACMPVQDLRAVTNTS